MPFSRTTRGKIARFLFFSEVLVWVEGPTDIQFFGRALHGLDCRIESTGGIEESKRLASEIIQHDYPFVVVLDGHYEILERKRSPHRRALMLKRHSSENYYFEADPIERVCKSLCRLSNPTDLTSARYNRFCNDLFVVMSMLLILDISHSKYNTGRSVFPDNVNAVLTKRKPRSISKTRVATLLRNARTGLTNAQIQSSDQQVNSFRQQHPFHHIVRGHFILSIIRLLVSQAVDVQLGHHPTLDNDALRTLLSSEVWANPPTAQHLSLRRRLRAAVSEAIKLRPSF